MNEAMKSLEILIKKNCEAGFDSRYITPLCEAYQKLAIANFLTRKAECLK